MDFNDVPLFLRIVQLGSFAKVAAELGVQRSSVSRSLGRLEQALGARLLQRTTRKLSLTDAGQLFFDHASAAVTGLDGAVNAVREFGGEPRGTVRVTAPPDAQTLGLAEVFMQFTRRYPAIHVELTITGRTVDLVGEGFDLAVRAGRLADSALVARRVGPSRLALFAAPSYLKGAGALRSVRDLKQHATLLFRSRGGTATLHLTGPKGEESVEVKGNLSADDMAFLFEACVAGAGVALLPAELARRAVLAGRLVRVLPAYYLGGGSVYVVVPSAALLPSRVALLRDHLVTHIQRELLEVEKACSGAEGPCPAGTTDSPRASRVRKATRR